VKSLVEKTSRLGISVADLTDDQKQELELDGGVLVQRVIEGAASKAGIGKGDVILSINNEPVKNAKQFQKLVDVLPAGESVAVLVQREGNPTFLAIKVPDAN
jgi:serine protease Do